MNTYFPNPFMPPLHGDSQGSTNGLGCNFNPLTASTARYDQSAGQGAGSYGMCGSQALQSGHYGPASPAHTHAALGSGAADHGGCDTISRTNVGLANGYDPQTGLTSTGGWNLPSTPQSPQSDYTPGNNVSCADNSLSPVSTTHSSFSPGSQPVPFYPWMGVVGRYQSLSICFSICYSGSSLMLLYMCLASAARFLAVRRPASP